MKRKIARVRELDETNGTYTLSAYLIAQLGKNFFSNVSERITGEQLLQAALDTAQWSVEFGQTNAGWRC